MSEEKRRAITSPSTGFDEGQPVRARRLDFPIRLERKHENVCRQGVTFIFHF